MTTNCTTCKRTNVRSVGPAAIALPSDLTIGSQLALSTHNSVHIVPVSDIIINNTELFLT